jgi:ABC-type proline/glycine betaine transport system ATPase subunit
MDEPFSALDPLTRKKLREAIRGMKHELNIPIIHVTHDIREALFLADEILPIVNGRVFHKWLLQFMLTAKEGFQCNEHSRETTEEMFDEIELPIRVKEYMR